MRESGTNKHYFISQILLGKTLNLPIHADADQNKAGQV